MFSIYLLVAGAVCIAFGIVLPIAFHMAGAMGSVFLPMHIPVMIAGLFIGAEAGWITGMITPLLSSLMTGMPPLMPVLPLMVVELSVYGFAGGYLHQRMRFSLLVSLIGAMIAGRLAVAATAYIMLNLLGIQLKPFVYLTAAVVTGLPGIIIQLMIVPLLVKRMQAALCGNRVKERYCEKEKTSN
ncbi:MAG: ECF transporter S component [Negativicutes bacterium]